MSQSEQLRLAIVIGSARAGRFGTVPANWFAGQARQDSRWTVDVIDLADLDFPKDMSSTPDVEDFSRRIDAADAIVVVTPEYNHSYSGPLKTAIDALGKEWHAKAIGFVAYGGMSGGLRAVEPLRVVFAELHAMTIRETVSFHGARAQFNEDGTPVDPDGVNAAAAKLLDQLHWWAAALKRARAEQPYGT